MGQTTRRGGRALACLLPLVLFAGLAFAQSGRCVMEGFVVGESDYPGIKGATIELIPDAVNDHLPRARATTDDKGKYSLAEIPHGEYTLRVSADGYTPYEIKIYMLSDTTTQLHVKLRK